MDVLRRAFGAGGGDVRKHGHLFKPKDKGIIPRVADVCGVLKSVRPSSVVDFGSQRGALLWSMMAALPDANFVAVDRDPKYLGLLRCVERGLAGRRLTVVDADVTQHIPSPAASADVVVMSEILEHLEQPELAVAEAKRLATSTIIVTVPSKPDDNPEHIQLFDRARLEALFPGANIRGIKSGWFVVYVV